MIVVSFLVISFEGEWEVWELWEIWKLWEL